MIYVTFDEESGALTGFFIQELQPEHSHSYLDVSSIPDLVNVWNNYRMNAGRTGIELIQVDQPGALESA